MADKLDVRDPSVAAIKARAAIARGRYARRRSAAAAGRGARAGERSGARAGAAAAHARPARRDGDPRAGRARRPTRARDPAGARARRRARCARSAASRKPTPRIATPRATRPAIRRSRPAGASCSSRSTTTREALKSFQMALQADARWTCRRWSARRARSSDDNPPQAVSARQTRARDQSLVGRRARVPRRGGDRRRPPRRSARGAGQGARRQPVEPRGARPAAARSPTSRTSRRSSRPRPPRRWRSRPTTATSTAIAGELAAHNYRFDEAVDADAPRAGARRRQPADARRVSASTCCAPATSRRRARRSTPRSRPTRSTGSPTTCCR